MLQLDQQVLSVFALFLWRLRSALGLKHWAVLSCIDAIFAGSFILFLLVAQIDYWFLLAPLALAAPPSARRREFLSQEETADFLNQPMKNPRQELLSLCLLRYGVCLVYVGLFADCIWEEGFNWLSASPLITGFIRALAEAADIYPTGKAIRDRFKVFLSIRTAAEIG